MVIKVLFYTLSTVIVILSSILITRRFKPDSLLDRVLGLSLFIVSQIILTELLLGVLIQSLTWQNLLIVNGVILIVVLGSFSKISNLLKDFKREFEILSGLSHLFQVVKDSNFIKLLLFFVAVESSIILFIGAFFPPGVWDCWTYHLTSVAYWMQDQAIKIIDTPVARSNFLPLNSELLNLWNVIFFRSDRMVSLTQFPFAFMAIIAVFGLGLKIGLNETNSLTASLLFFFTPISLLQSSTAQNDLIASTTFLIGIYFAYAFVDSLCLKTLLLSGIASGILVGTKSQGLLFGLLLLGYILFETMRKVKLTFLVKMVVIYLIPIALLGGFVYIRNWIYFHNPFYPATIGILGIRVFSGNPDIWNAFFQPGLTTFLQNIAGLWDRWFEVHDHFGIPEISGYGPQWIIIGIPSIVYAFVFFFKHQLKKEAKLLFFIIFSFFPFLFLHKPNPWDMRLTLFLPSAGALAAGLLLQHASSLCKSIIKFIIILSILYAVVNSTLYNAYAPLSRFRLALNIPSSERTIENFAPWFERFEGFRVIGRLAQSGDAIGYLTHGDGWIYPLFGRHFEHRVYNIDRGSAEALLDLIRQRKIKYLILHKDGNLKIREFIQESPQLFLLNYEGENSVYRVIEPSQGN